MTEALSPNTQAILLLTAPLSLGSNAKELPLVTPARYRRLAEQLHKAKLEPADFLGKSRQKALAACQEILTEADAVAILDRGLQLSQAVDRWRTRSIWVVSRADPKYPRRFRERFAGDAPAVLYGCGDISLLESGGLAMVGSRKVDDDLAEATDRIARLAAEAGIVIVSGGAKGIDQIAMQASLDAGGRAVGVVADTLERKVLDRKYLDALADGRLVLVSPFDPSSRFFVGNAMQRNKYIYGFSDAGLVMNADFEKGGTWTGAVEQLDKLQLVPVFVRSTEKRKKALDALIEKGALVWPDPCDAENFRSVLERIPEESIPKIRQLKLSFGTAE